jgi:hypothetical protein
MATTALIIGALATAGSAAYQANQASNIDAGQTPEAALYQPVDYGDLQTDTLVDNYQNLDAMNWVSRKANRFLTQQDLRRAEKFVPGFKSIMATQGANVNDLVNGRLPYDDALGIVGESNSLSNAIGIPGTGAPGTLRDLGLSQLQGMQAGQGLLQGMVGIAEQVSPIARYSRPQDFMLTPSQTIPWEIQQQQLIQQSTQNANNLAAGVSPTQMAQNAATLSGANNPYAGIGPAISSIGAAASSPSAFGGSPTAGGYAIPNYSTWQGGPQPATYYTPPNYQPRVSSQYSIPAF